MINKRRSLLTLILSITIVMDIQLYAQTICDVAEQIFEDQVDILTNVDNRNNTLVWRTKKQQDFNIYKKKDGEEAIRISNPNTRDNSSPSISGDGNSVAYTAKDVTGIYQIYLYDQAGQTHLISDMASEGNFSPMLNYDGSTVVWISYIDKKPILMKKSLGVLTTFEIEEDIETIIFFDSNDDMSVISFIASRDNTSELFVFRNGVFDRKQINSEQLEFSISKQNDVVAWVSLEGIISISKSRDDIIELEHGSAVIRDLNVSPDGSTLFWMSTTSGMDRMHYVRLETDEAPRTISVPSGSQDLVLSTNGNIRAWISESRIYLQRDQDNPEIIHETDNRITHLEISADGTKVKWVEMTDTGSFHILSLEKCATEIASVPTLSAWALFIQGLCLFAIGIGLNYSRNHLHPTIYI